MHQLRVYSRNVQIINLVQLKMKIPKLLSFYFLFIQFTFGMDFGFTMEFDKTVQYKVRCFTRFVTSVITISLIYASFDIYYEGWFWHNCLEYTMLVVILYRLNYNFYDYLADVNRLNGMVATETTFVNALVIYFFIMFMIKVIFAIIRCMFETNAFCIDIGVPYYMLFQIGTVGFDGIALIQIVLYYYFYKCLKILKDGIKKNLIVKDALYRYKAIADLYDKSKPLYSSLVSTLRFFFKSNGS